jgi:methylglyoxal synthase
MNHSNYFKNIKRIAIIANPDTRKEFIEWSYAYKNILKNHIIISTARTASILEGTLNTPILNLSHGKSGGYAEVRDLIEDKKVDVIIFFGNPLKAAVKESWFEELVHVAINEDLVVAYNPATIDMVLTSIAIKDADAVLDNNVYRLLQQELITKTVTA